LVKEIWPTSTVVPEMSTGATDGLYVRNGGIPVYGVSAVFENIDDVRAHGRDERVGVEEFHRAVAFWYRMLKALTAPEKSAD
jgi:acetylornithine deacetylase/succinyl-diaminopimelate desuccinylase-like protein